jgi:type VI protein secretion system component VasF
MKKIQIDVLSETLNCPVVQMPGRRFPGVVLQGDSLKILLDSAEEVQRLCSSLRNPDLSAAVASLRQKLAGYVASYEEAMTEAGRDLPYPKRT